ncbi:MAG: glycosyltransferase family 39 protein [Minisyncoccia bacterium]
MEIISPNSLKKAISKNKTEFSIFFGALLTGMIASLFFHKYGMLTMLVDANAHLNIARQLIDSITPGFSQLGLWPPLLHIAISPFAQIDFLWRSGLAGSIPSVLFFSISCVYIYKLIEYITKNKALSLLGVFIFAANPYVLYFSSVAMMEILFLMNLIIAVFHYAKWEKESRVIDLAVFSVFISLASLSRFEGLILPIVFLLPILLKKEKFPAKRQRGKLEATLIIFLLLSGFGAALIFLYNSTFAGNPLAFMSGEWSAFAQQHKGGFALPAENSAYNSFLYMFSASSYMAGTYLIAASFLALIYLSARSKKTEIKALFILLAPLLFNVLSLYKGSSVIYTPDLAPFERFFNVRYGLLIVPFVAVSIPFFLGGIKHKTLKQASAVVVLALSIHFFALNAAPANFVITKEAAGYPSPEIEEMTNVFKRNYDGGKILIVRGLNDFFIINSGIRISDTINESNYLYWEQSLKEPWIFARWAVMLNPDSGMIWETKKDEISAKWADDSRIYKLYDINFENKDYIVLKIKEDEIKKMADKNNLNKEKIPSLNPDIKKWDTRIIKNEIKN